MPLFLVTCRSKSSKRILLSTFRDQAGACRDALDSAAYIRAMFCVVLYGPTVEPDPWKEKRLLIRAAKGCKSSAKRCRQMHLTRVFSHAPCTCDHTHIVAQGVSVRISLHPHAIHDVTCLSVRLLSLRVCLFPVSLPLLLLLFHCLPVLCPAHQLPCRHRRGLKPPHSRIMRSIAPWRYTILSPVMSPSSSTTSTTQRLLQ